jgi:hypothetical protein
MNILILIIVLSILIGFFAIQYYNTQNKKIHSNSQSVTEFKADEKEILPSTEPALIPEETIVLSDEPQPLSEVSEEPKKDEELVSEVPAVKSDDKPQNKGKKGRKPGSGGKKGGKKGPNSKKDKNDQLLLS